MSINDKFIRLKNWIESCGGKFSKIELQSGIHGKYYVASEPIKKDEPLISIPKCLWLDENHPSVVNFGDLEPCEKTIVALVNELRLGQNSLYWPYIDLLPLSHEFYSHPLYQCRFLHNQTHTSTLIYSPQLEEWRGICPKFAQQIEYLIESYLRHWKGISSNYNVLESEYQYVYLLYLTRNWGKFIPGADLFQHRSYNSSPANVNGQIFDICSGDNYSIGQEIYINYGLKNNLDLLSQYGFATSNDFIFIDYKFLRNNDINHDVFEPMILSLSSSLLTCDRQLLYKIIKCYRQTYFGSRIKRKYQSSISNQLISILTEHERICKHYETL